VVGAVIGNYQIVGKLGEGGMGVVYLGQHTLLGRRAAIKVLLPVLSARPDIVNRFFNEARAVTSISDPGIVQIHDFGYHTDGSAYIVMEFLDGEALDRRLARHGRLAPFEALRLCRQIAASLAAAHAQHIIHRDLKPENVFLVPDGEVAAGERTKILDFGIAKLADDHPGKLKTNTGMLVGTPAYMSPEQCRGLSTIDHRSDIYSLGCVLFHLLTGRPPFEGEGPGDILSSHIREHAPAPSALAPGISPGVDALVSRCLAKSPDDRYSRMLDVAAAISDLLQVTAQDAPVGERPPHMLPTTRVSTAGMPTTLSASASQFRTGPGLGAATRARRLWITGAFVAVAAVVGIAIVAAKGSAPPQVATAGAMREPEQGSPDAPSEPPPGQAVARPAPEPSAPPPQAPAPAIATPPEPAKTPPAEATATPPEPPKSPPPAAEPHPGGSNEPKAPKVTKHPERDSTASPERPGTHKSPTEAPKSPPSHGTPPPAAPAPTASAQCTKAAFAAVYDVPEPPAGSVRAALRSLKLCHDTKAIGDAEFEQLQAALVARL